MHLKQTNKQKILIYTLFNALNIHFSYYTLMIWFPELFYRFEEFEKNNANKSASVCDVSSVVLEPDVNG